MNGTTLTQSPRDPATATYDAIVPAGEPWIHEILKGHYFRILDLEGNQAADTLFYNAADYDDRYSAQDTIRAQANIYLTTGTRLMSSKGNVLLTIVADTCGRHDTLGGACATESNMVRYAIEKRHMHACRQSFVKAALAWGRGFGQLLIVSGLLLVIFVGDFGGVWTSFIGWFLVAAAEAELQAATVRNVLAGVSVRDVMTPNPVTVDPDASVQEFMEAVFLPTRHAAFPVVKDGAPVGIVGFRQALALPREAWPSTRVRDLMADGAVADAAGRPTAGPPTASPTASCARRGSATAG